MADRPLAPATLRSIKDLRFVVVGGYVADCFVYTSRLPVWGDNYRARSIRTSPGGKALNQAVALARLGAQVTAIGAAGDDPLGRDIVEVLTREGVNTDFFRTHAGVASPICVCFVGEEGQPSFVWHIDDDVAVIPETVRAASEAIASADAVLLTFELPMATIEQTIKLARAHGARVFVQPAPPLPDGASAAALPWDQIEVLAPNEDEARALLDDERARDLPADGLAGALAAHLAIPAVVVTLGESGCVAHAAGVTRLHPAQKTAAVDTTGAGDAFMATFAARFTAGGSMGDAISAAQSAAAWAIQHGGGHESMPYGS